MLGKASLKGERLFKEEQNVGLEMEKKKVYGSYKYKFFSIAENQTMEKKYGL